MISSNTNINNNRKHILLGHLGRRGDCLYATTVARQIKHDFPDSHLTWAISSMCRSVIDGNPYVDKIWELPFNTNEEIVHAWKEFEIDAKRRKNAGEFDEVCLTQVHPGNMQYYDGTSRASIFRGYSRPITVPVEPVVRLSAKEIDNARHFADSHGLASKKHAVLFECASTSGQSFVDPYYAVAVARHVLKRNPDVAFILSSNNPIKTQDDRIIDGSVLTFKENAELTKYCSLLVGCSSGISWLATSDWAKPLPKIQLLRANTFLYASMMHDAIYFGLPTDQIIEMFDCSSEKAALCIEDALNDNFILAKNRYHQDIPLNFKFYFMQVYLEMLAKNELGKAAGSLSVTTARFGNHPQLVYFINSLFLPYTELVSSAIPFEEREVIAQLRSLYNTGQDQRSGTVISLMRIFTTLFRRDTRMIGKGLLKRLLLGSL